MRHDEFLLDLEICHEGCPVAKVCDKRLGGSVTYAHYSDVTMSAMASQITSALMVTQPFVRAQIKYKIKAQRHWSLWGEFTGEFPA